MKIFLSSIKNQSGVSGLSSDEDLLFTLIKNSPYQQRKQFTRHPLLDKAAQIKADDMAQKNYFAHIAPDGIGPNDIIRSVGYVLPIHYLAGKNNCESLSIGGSSPQEIAEGWYKSDRHRPHVYAEDKFYREQGCIGIGSAIAQDGRIMYVFFSAPCM